MNVNVNSGNRIGGMSLNDNLIAGLVIALKLTPF